MKNTLCLNAERLLYAKIVEKINYNTRGTLCAVGTAVPYNTRDAFPGEIRDYSKRDCNPAKRVGHRIGYPGRHLDFSLPLHFGMMLTTVPV